jgi:hypothetical protein
MPTQPERCLTCGHPFELWLGDPLLQQSAQRRQPPLIDPRRLVRTGPGIGQLVDVQVDDDDALPPPRIIAPPRLPQPITMMEVKAAARC